MSSLAAALKMRERPPDGTQSTRPEDRKNRTDVPVISFTDFDSVGQVKTALYQHERGQFALSAQLIDRMMWDDRIKGVTESRIKALSGLPININMADTGAPSDAASNDPACKALKLQWRTMFPNAALNSLRLWGIYLGVGLGQLTWDTGTQATPKLKVWHPQYIYWRWDTRSFWVTTMEGACEVVPGDKQWVLYTPYGYQLGWLGGLVRSLAIPYMCRQWAFRDWARSSEVHGTPIRGLVVPAEAKREDKDRALQDIAALGRESVVMLPRASDDDMFDLKLIEASVDSHKTFLELINQCNSSIAITLLGQNLTTEVNTGSRAAATVHDRVRGDVLKDDAQSTADCLREQVVKPWVTLNYGTDPMMAPVPTWTVDPPEDKAEQSLALQQLAAALQTFKNAAAPVDLRAILEEYDVPLLTAAQAAAVVAATPPPAAPGAPGPAAPAATTAPAAKGNAKP